MGIRKLRIRKHYPGNARVNCSLEDTEGKILAQGFAATKEDERELKRLTAFPELIRAVRGLLAELKDVRESGPDGSKFPVELWTPRRRAIRSRRISDAEKALRKAERGKG